MFIGESKLLLRGLKFSTDYIINLGVLNIPSRNENRDLK